jgi:hypothetical protein
MNPICPYCNKESVFYQDSSIIYRKNYGPIYYCKDCDASVGCHPGTTTPLGRLANKELRVLRNRGHLIFDKLWRDGKTRQTAYKVLAERLGISVDDCHFGHFDIDMCQKAINEMEKDC